MFTVLYEFKVIPQKGVYTYEAGDALILDRIRVRNGICGYHWADHDVDACTLELTDWSDSLAFPQFNPALGTLDGVELMLSSSIDTVLTVTNNDAELNSAGFASTEVQITIDPDTLLGATPELDIKSSNFYFSDLAPGAQVISDTLTKSGTYDETYILQAILNEFTGTGTIVLPASTFTTTSISFSGGNAAAVQATNASLTGTITYDYTPAPPQAPEPATLTLLGGLLIAGGLASRRRTARKG